MPITALPTPPPVSLATPADWAAWEGVALPRRSQAAHAEFWATMVPLTVPQELAIRLHRPTERVPIRAIRRRAEALEREWRAGHFLREPLRAYARLWDRSHVARTFRVVPSRGTGALAADNPVRHLLAWAQGDEIFEDRWLRAAADRRFLPARRAERLRNQLRDAARGGYVVWCEDVRVPALQWCPTPRIATEWGIRAPVMTKARAHEACAVEAALRLAYARDRGAPVQTLRSGAQLAARARSAAGRRLRRGDRIEAVADLEIVTVDGYGSQVEVLSNAYTDADLAAKYAGLPASIAFVATSRTVAARVARVSPGAHCWHF